MEFAAFAALGLAAGAVTTLAGLGGGLLLTLAMAAWVGPQTALAIAAPALLLGNVHRIWLFRAHLDRKLALPFVLGAFPGALVGGFAAVAMPEWALRVLIVGAAALAVARQLDGFKWRPGPRAVVPATFTAGVLTATSGGGGLLLGPLLLMSGARAERFIATASLVALTMHVARSIAYGVGGLVDAQTLLRAGTVGVCILLGNLLGRLGRTQMSEARGTALTYVVLGVCVVLAIAPLG